jgi:hypothetical protein
LEKLGRRWWFVTPAGHGTLIRAVAKVDTADYGGSGGFLAYDGVFLQTAAGRMSPNLKAAAEDSLPRDVVHPETGVTLQAKGDAIYLGSSRFKPNFTYVCCKRLGSGGRVRWYYSSTVSAAGGWKPVGPAGNPQRAAALGGQGSWSFDAGNFMGPDESGFGKWEHPRANRLTCWDMTCGFPEDFAKIALPGDPVPRYYLKGVVEQPFSAAPILNQAYERADLDEAIARKYGPGDYRAKWAKAITARLRGWGFNAAGQYSGQYVVQSPRLEDRLPLEPTVPLGGMAAGKNSPYPVKNVYDGAVFPPGSSNAIYRGLQPDVFDPCFEKAYMELVPKHVKPDLWSWAIIPEEADYLFGIDSLTHDHLGYVVLSQNPHHRRGNTGGDDSQAITYAEPRLWAKYALRDFLRHRYRAASEDLRAPAPGSATPAYAYAAQPAGTEAAALERLNTAWGTRYTTWQTSAGDVLAGSNAWGRGTGFLDENGRGVLAKDTRGIGFDKAFTNPAHSAIRKDLDDFLGLFAARYGSVLQKAFAQVPHPVLLMPLYNAPECVYRAVGPYVDAFWVNVPEPQDALRIYQAAGKPLVVADYYTASPDSPWHFRAAISSVRYDAASGRTVIVAPELRYMYRMPQFVCFPDCGEINEKSTAGGKHVERCQRVQAAHWNQIEVPGDYSGALRPGMHVEFWHEPALSRCRTQEDRAGKLTERWQAMLNLRGADGVAFIVGLEHWCLYDPAVSNWCDNENFGLATLQDNAYDGQEARRSPGIDARGYPIGGEDADYGNLLGEVGRFLGRIAEDPSCR